MEGDVGETTCEVTSESVQHPNPRSLLSVVAVLAVVVSTGCIGAVTDALVSPETHRGTVRTDQVWEGIHRISGDLAVEGVVRIRCGTHIQLDSAAAVEVGDGGRIISEGRAGCPVVWTSARAGPRPGDWGAVDVRNGGALVASRTTFEFGGAQGAAIQVRDGGRVELRDVAIRRAPNGGLEVRPGAELLRAQRLEFVDVRGDPARIPVGQLGRFDAPSFVETASSIVAYGGTVDEPMRWDFPFKSIEIIGDVEIRARTTVGAETRVRLFPDTTVTVASGGAIRALGDGRLSYRSAHRWVRFSFGPESKLEITPSAAADNRFQWALFSGSGTLEIADPGDVRFHRSRVFGRERSSHIVAEAERGRERVKTQ